MKRFRVEKASFLTLINSGSIVGAEAVDSNPSTRSISSHLVNYGIVLNSILTIVGQNLITVQIGHTASICRLISSPRKRDSYH